MYHVPNPEQLLNLIKETKHMTTWDLNAGFWQAPMDQESWDLLTFATPFGRYAYTRLPFGISSALETFQKIVADRVGDIPGVVVYIDDIFIYVDDQDKHDRRVREVLNCLFKKGFSLNSEKCHWNQTLVRFLGHILEEGSIRLDPEKI